MNDKLILADSRVPLPAIGSWRSSAHRFSAQQVQAIEAAQLSGRPLLVRGEPGLGKSQIARAVAAVWEWRLVTAVINARTEVDDLLYRIDHVSRLSDANRIVVQHDATQSADAKQDLSLHRYLQKGPVWQALQAHEGQSFEDRPKPGPGHYDCEDACVLLIDEIDKAHPDIPNALLEVLNAGAFQVPATGEVVSGDPEKLFVVITANEERSLPAAFLRRCAVLHLQLSDDPTQQLQEFAEAHKEAGLFTYVDASIFASAATVLHDHRKKSNPGEYRPGTSEYLDLLRVIDKKLANGTMNEADVDAVLDQMSEYLINKNFREDRFS